MKLNNTLDELSCSLNSDKRLYPSASNPNGASSISPVRMERGRDEMNLAEFPLSGLSNRLKGEKSTLVFEERVADKERGGTVDRRLTVSPSVEYGLPRALDDEVILGLVQLSKATDFSGRNVSFVPAELFRILGWREEGRSYTRLETSLKRWLGVTLYYNNAWRDNAKKIWVDEHFHLLERVVVRRRRTGGDTRLPGKSRGLWSVTWNEVVFRSFEAGYLKKLDMELYRELHLTAAKRMYRFLDKRLHFRRHRTFDLRTFACEHIGFGRRDDNSQLKRRFNPAIDELEKAGFLEPISKKNRYRRVCRGKWEVVFERKRRKDANESLGSLEAALTERGVWEPVAVRLVRDHPASSINAAIEEFDEKVKGKTHVSVGNPPGLLVAWINERCTIGARNEKGPASLELEKPCPKSREQQSQTEPRKDASAMAVKRYLGSLSPKAQELLEEEAFAGAEPHLKEGYQRSLDAGSKELQGEYREMIISSHVRKVLAAKPS